MNKNVNFTDISAQLLHKYRVQLVAMLQQQGVLISPAATDDQIIKAYLVTVADSASFRREITAFVYSHAMRSADAVSTCDPGDPNAVNDPGCPQYWSAHPMDSGGSTAPAQTTSSSGSGGFFSGLGKVLSSQQFQTVLDTAAAQINNQNVLQQQNNQIKLKTLDLQNNAMLASAGILPAGTRPSTGLSTGAKIGIFVAVLAVAGIVVVVVSKNKTGHKPSPKPMPK